MQEFEPDRASNVEILTIEPDNLMAISLTLQGRLYRAMHPKL